MLRRKRPSSDCSSANSSCKVPSGSLSFTARDLTSSTPGAWQAFLAYASNVFPLLGNATAQDSGTLKADVPHYEEGLLKSICDQVSKATLSSLKQLRRLRKEPMQSVATLPRHHREICQLKALTSFAELEMASLRREHELRLQEMQSAVLRSSEVGDVLCKLRTIKEELAQSRLQQEQAKRELAEKSVSPIEELCKRLRELRERRRQLLAKQRLRTVRVEDLGANGEAVLIFRGQHRLRLRPCEEHEGSRASGADPMYRLRFEPYFPGPWIATAISSSRSVEGEMLRSYEDLLCRVWLQALNGRRGSDRQGNSGASVLRPLKEVARIVQRLDVALLDVADLVRSVASRLSRTPKPLAASADWDG